ncbi:amino acid ABC transporter permease [Lachnotalea glycerini]|uniref:Amino acid ABC transporter permease n=1 Tax=Lachnotalea glycerini TaxID=1763509 RepID=A0A371JJV0_9FIRM|nr:amino acid ABC transporter permease [Lachnotalea glycerini]RDY32980.1 amino acid ABC transporter permease [Lachnotalea glycerini]
MNEIEKMIGWLPALFDGLKITLSLSVISVISGLILSLFLALGKISKNKILQKLSGAYIFFFRGTPLLMQLFFIYYALPQISSVFTIKSRFIAAFIAFTLNSAAYQAEIIRAAIQSIDKGQFEAAKALGMTHAQTMRLVIIPQSYRRLIPPVGNEFIMVIKDTSLVSTIALVDLMKRTSQIQSSASSALVYIPAMIMYLIVTAIFTYVFDYLEKKFSVYE